MAARSSWTTSLSLIEQARTDDPDAWRRLCDIYSPMVYGWARRAGLKEEDAADIVQDVFRIVARTIGRFRNDRPGDTFRGWLLTITRNEIRGWIRRHTKQPAQGVGGSEAKVALEQIPDWVVSDVNAEEFPVDQTTQQELIRRAAELVRRDFEPRTWQAFWRSAVEGHDTSEIAAELQLTPNAVRQAKFRVLARLRETLSDP